MATTTQAAKPAGKVPTVTVDGKSYNIADLSPEARKHLQAYSLADAEVRRISLQLGMIKTARAAYQHALTSALPKAAK